MGQVPQHPLGEQDPVRRSRQGVEGHLDLVLLPDHPVRLPRLDVADLAVTVFHAYAHLDQQLERAPPQRLAEHERRHRVVAPVVRTVDVALVPPLAQEVLDFAERHELHARGGQESVRGSADDRVGRLRKRLAVRAAVAAQQDQCRDLGERIQES